MTCRVHGEEAASRVRDASAVLFGESSIKDASQEVLDTLSAEIPCAEADLAETDGATDLLVLCGACDSKGNAKKKIKEGGAYLNGEKIADAGRRLTEDDLLAGRYAQLNVGKKDFRLIKFK